ncbi:hypothetical protein [Hoeflea alexandrii]|uniref:hypothetical protein n=1 Tax=Hoeflea alexandrii TaxID=288436 RepID=UPI003CCD4307
MTRTQGQSAFPVTTALWRSGFFSKRQALERLAGLTRSPDTAYLDAFDRYRKQIETAAIRSYGKKRASLVRLSFADF